MNRPGGHHGNRAPGRDRGPRDPGGDAFAEARGRMVETHLLARGIRDPRVLAAMATVPREDSVPAEGDDIAALPRLMCGLSAGYRLTIADDSTHIIQYDRPDLVGDAILRLVDWSQSWVSASPRALAAGAARPM